MKRKALALIAQISGKGVEGLTPEQELVADLGMDSPKALILLFELEEETGVEVSDEDASGIYTVGDVLEYVGRVC